MAVKKNKKTVTPEATKQPVEPKSTEPSALIERFYHPNQNKIQNWMWIGVGAIAIIIIIFWGVSMKLQIENVLNGSGSDAELINQTSNSWNQAFTDQTTNKNTATSVRAHLNKIINTIISVSSTTSSTESLTASSTTSTTSVTTTKNLPTKSVKTKN